MKRQEFMIPCQQTQAADDLRLSWLEDVQKKFSYWPFQKRIAEIERVLSNWKEK
jgi:hypothetical protein